MKDIFLIPVTAWLMSLIQENLSCSVTSSELVAIVGEKVSFNCNARPNNESQGTVSKWTLGNEGTSGTLIYQPPLYSPRGKVIVEQYVADGYFLSYADEDLINVTIQIKETQLRHGGKYFCSCSGQTSSVATVNLAVLEPKQAFIQNETKVGEITDLHVNCSMSVFGYTPSASIDLTIFNATGVFLVQRSKLPLVQNVTNHHVTYRVNTDSKEAQNFTCECKLWTKYSDGRTMVYSFSSSLYLTWDMKTSSETVPASPFPMKTVIFIACVAVVVIVVVILLICLLKKKYERCHKRKTNIAVDSMNIENSDFPIYSMPEEYSEIPATIQRTTHAEKCKEHQECETGSEVFVFENDLYDTTPRIIPSGNHKRGQIFSGVL